MRLPPAVTIEYGRRRIGAAGDATFFRRLPWRPRNCLNPAATTA